MSRADDHALIAFLAFAAAVVAVALWALPNAPTLNDLWP